jgi:phosphohistidine phosphatase
VGASWHDGPVGDPSHPSGGRRRLVVLRHAKSDWPPGVPDDERPLSGRGRRDAKAAGEWLATNGLRPDAVLCSPAARTRETWARLVSGLESGLGSAGPVPEPTYEDAIYEASVSSLTRVLRAVDEKAKTVLLVGHNPGVHELVVELAEQADEKARVLAAASFPTSGLAVLKVSGPWSKLAPGSAELLEFAVPRG